MFYWFFLIITALIFIDYLAIQFKKKLNHLSAMLRHGINFILSIPVPHEIDHWKVFKILFHSDTFRFFNHYCIHYYWLFCNTNLKKLNHLSAMLRQFNFVNFNSTWNWSLENISNTFHFQDTLLGKRNNMIYQETSSLLSLSCCFHSKGPVSNYFRYGYDEDTTWLEKPHPPLNP